MNFPSIFIADEFLKEKKNQQNRSEAYTFVIPFAELKRQNLEPVSASIFSLNLLIDKVHQISATLRGRKSFRRDGESFQLAVTQL